jgi:hypothetical protein
MRPPTIVLGFLLLGFSLAPPARAADFSLASFHADVHVQTDAAISVTETIVATFPDPRHGLFRRIPFRYTDAAGNTVTVPIEVTAVNQDGRVVDRSVYREGDNLVIRIGNPRRTITGVHTYTVAYTAKAAVNFFPDHDELYWNVTGSDWSGAAIPAASATVELPDGAFGEQLTAACYTGAFGSAAAACTWEFTGSGAKFSAADYLTVALGWPSGVVTKPLEYDAVRASAARSPGAFGLTGPWVFVVLALNVLIPAATTFGLILRWRAHGRDPAAPQTLVVQYEPPLGLSPAESHVVVREGFSPNTDTVATIVDLAVRGYVRIVETEQPRTLGIGKRRAYRFERVKAHAKDAAVKGHERFVLDALFTDADGAEREAVDLANLRETFPGSLGDIRSALVDQVTTGGYFHRNPETVRMLYLFTGLGIAAVGMLLVFWRGLVGVPAAGVLVMVAARYFPKRTVAGVAALQHLRGFLVYLEKAETYRIRWQEKENIFEQYLPYAMVFGVAEKWSKAFAGLTRQQPSWYNGPAGASFNSLVLWSSLSGMSAQAVHSFSPAASGRSGMGSGGFSGGGFGGGGGGSW